MHTDDRPDDSVQEAHDYRAIRYTRDGCVAEVRPLVASSDADAIVQTAALDGDLSMDLWDGLRFVEHFEGRPIAADYLLIAVSARGSL